MSGFCPGPDSLGRAAHPKQILTPLIPVLYTITFSLSENSQQWILRSTIPVNLCLLLVLWDVSKSRRMGPSWWEGTQACCSLDVSLGCRMLWNLWFSYGKWEKTALKWWLSTTGMNNPLCRACLHIKASCLLLASHIVLSPHLQSTCRYFSMAGWKSPPLTQLSKHDPSDLKQPSRSLQSPTKRNRCAQRVVWASLGHILFSFFFFLKDVFQQGCARPCKFYPGWHLLGRMWLWERQSHLLDYQEMGITYIKQEILVCLVWDKIDGPGKRLENFCIRPSFTAGAVDYSFFSTSISRKESKISLAALSLGVEVEPIFISTVSDVCIYCSRCVSPRAEVGPEGENMGACLLQDAQPMSQCAGDQGEALLFSSSSQAPVMQIAQLMYWGNKQGKRRLGPISAATSFHSASKPATWAQIPCTR